MDPVLSLPQPRSPGHIHKTGPRLQSRWRSYIDAEQNSVEALLADSFKSLCAQTENCAETRPDNGRYHRMRADSFGSSSALIRNRTGSGSSTSTAITDLYSGTLSRTPAVPINRAAYSHGTLPRNKVVVGKKDSCTNCGHHTQSGFQLSSPPPHPTGVSWGAQRPPLGDSPVRRLSFSSQHTTVPSHHGSSHQLCGAQLGSSHQLCGQQQPQHIPAGIAELDAMYKAMKNLNSPLPNAPMLGGMKMPAVYPLHHHSMEDNLDTGSLMGDIPPPPPPVQSHAVLESGLGHELRTPGTLRKLDCSWPKPPNIPLPPLPPKRTSSRLSDLIKPTNLNLSNDSDNSNYSRPKPFTNRGSLMSTGSSDSSGSSLPSEPELPLSPLTPSSELVFTWPNYTISSSPTNHRSVSQNCHSDDNSVYSGGNSINTSMTSSNVYVKMAPVFNPDNPDGPYMNLLYSAVQQQGGKGSVESAMSPYLAMTGLGTNWHVDNNIRNLHNAAIDSVSAIYAQIESSKGSVADYEVGGKVTPTRANNNNKPRSPSNKSKALAEFRDLMLEVERKRNFRVGLNLFNTQPDIGIDFLVKQGFLDLAPVSVAKFLIDTPDLARSKIGEYIGQLQNAFSMKVLGCFVEKFDFAGLRIDKAMRKFLAAVQIPGEAQKIEKIMEVFGKRFLKCNPGFCSKLKAHDSVVTLACAVMLLNTDLHTPNLKPDKKMLEKDFMTNLKGADGGTDFETKLLKAIYKGIKKQGFQTGVDHVTQAALLRTRISGKAPSLAEPHRRLVCLCRLAEVADINTKKEAEANAHPRDIWLFNDMLLVTKMSGKNAEGPVYSYRDSCHLTGLEVTLFHTPVYKFGIQISRKTDGAVLSTLNAASEQDRYKFVMDLQEAIFEMDVMGRALRDANLIK